MLRFADDARTLDLGVHDLLDAGPPGGHLVLRSAWSARARMRAGQVAHADYQSDREASDARFQREVAIRHRLVVRGWECTIHGRIDGVSEEGGRRVVEEIKSTALPSERLAGATADDFPAWVQQLRLYLWFLAAQRPSEEPLGRLVLVSLADGSRRILQVQHDPETGAFIRRQLEWILAEHEERVDWLLRRRRGPVPFAHGEWRSGQRKLAEQVYAALDAGRHLLIEAPTGLGKTAAVLHGALSAARQSGLRIFFATARTTQQRLALQTLRRMGELGLPIRAVSIRAREKACLNDVVACRHDACRFAARYHDKLREAGLPGGMWSGVQVSDPETVRGVARAHEVCPFALSLELGRGADVIVGDYNYVFDPSVRLSVVADNPGEWIVIADEAHQLAERAMGYGSPSLSTSLAREAADLLQGRSDGRARACRDLALRVEDWLREAAPVELERARDSRGIRELATPLGGALAPRRVRELADEFDALALDFALMKMEGAVMKTEEGGPDPWADLARAVSRLRAAVDRAGEETVAIWRWEPGGEHERGLFGARGGGGGAVTLHLLCRDPSGLLGPFFESLAGSVCMSATLTPFDFHRSMLGLAPERVEEVRHPSPFPPDHRRVLVVPHVSTEYRRRDRDRAEIARLVSETVRAVPGNAAVFFPSFAFLEQTEPLLDLGERPVLVQARAMTEEDRASLLATMARGEGHVLLAVLGGIFAEGIDLCGQALLAAVIVGPSLPQANLERRLLQGWFQERYGQGFRYAWLVPGLARVVQAAGRVIRTPEDRGAIVLIGRRFLLHDYRALLPDDWDLERTADPAEALAGFWSPG